MSFEVSSIRGGRSSSGIGTDIKATEGVVTVAVTTGQGALCIMNLSEILWSLVPLDTLNFCFISFSISSLCWAIISTVIGRGFDGPSSGGSSALSVWG